MDYTQYDYVIIGAGIYGLYTADLLGKRGAKVALLETDAEPLTRASYINQARVHNGYHYPRSVSTAAKSAHYYERFNREFEFAVHSTFRKVYAISAYDSLTNAEQFEKFCRHVGIPAEEINVNKYFQNGMIEAAFETNEYTYDAEKIRYWYVDRLAKQPNVKLLLSTTISRVQQGGSIFELVLNNGAKIITPAVINATYASINQLHALFGQEPFRTKYELCEVILTKAGAELSNVGITVMDGPFFSIMPFGLSGHHSLTSVTYTPHETSAAKLPSFECQTMRADCSENHLQNCNSCPVRPASAWVNMSQQAKKYLNPALEFRYEKSLFAVKTILNSAELDDSRPTVIRATDEGPKFISVMSGKFNTIYDLEEVLP